MKKFQKLLLLLLIILGSSVTAFPQVLKPVKWGFTTKQISNSEVQLIFTATIDPTWHLYSQDIPPDGPVPTSFTFEPGPGYKLIGKVKEPKAKEEFDKNFDMVVKYFADKAVFTQKIEVLTDKDFVIKGFLEFMCCDDSRCLPPDEVDFEFRVKGNPDAGKIEVPVTESVVSPGGNQADTAVAVAVADTVATVTGEIKPADGGGLEEHSSLWTLFFFSFIAGLAAILTPCVFPMIPMTVTFFLIFMFFAASFLGMFEITLPSWLINKSDSQADRGGIIGSFFMAFTLVLVSFSCTGPIVGAILVASASGQVLEPIIGMLGFSLAFALPFTLFAFFPRWLNNMPKSGGWLNSVKVVLGFIELALGLKFLSIADQTYHWGILDREIYLAFWIVIFTLMGFYLLGKLKFSHDSDLKFISVPRLSLAIITFTFVLYMIPGMFGAPLQALSGYLPPQATHDFDLNKIVRDNVQVFGGGGGSASEKPSGLCDKPKHGELLHLPHGLEGYFDYEQGLACATQQDKPVFIDFTGHGCVNCREMEARVWSDPRVLKKLREEFVIVALYVDDKTQLPESEWITSTYDGKVKKTIGKKYADFQISRFNVNAQPYYVLLDTKGSTLVPPKAYDLNVENFLAFLEAGLTEFRARQ